MPSSARPSLASIGFGRSKSLPRVIVALEVVTAVQRAMLSTSAVMSEPSVIRDEASFSSLRSSVPVG